MIGVTGAIIVGIVEVVFELFVDGDAIWQSEWAIRLVWELLYLFVLWWTMVVFPPSLKSKDFASMVELQEDTDHNSIEMRSNRVRQESIASTPPKLGEEVFMS